MMEEKWPVPFPTQYNGIDNEKRNDGGVQQLQAMGLAIIHREHWRHGSSTTPPATHIRRIDDEIERGPCLERY